MSPGREHPFPDRMPEDPEGSCHGRLVGAAAVREAVEEVTEHRLVLRPEGS